LRNALPASPPLLAVGHQTLHWRPEGEWSADVLEFESAAARAAEAERRGEPRAEREALDRAAALHQDELLPGLYAEWLAPRSTQLTQQLGAVLERLAALDEKSGDYPAAIGHAQRLSALDPLREAHCQSLMRLHAKNGDRASALRVYHQFMRQLQRE